MVQGAHYARFSLAGWYAAFSVSNSQLPMIKEYIVNQKIHHIHKTFEEEWDSLLRKHMGASE